MSVTFAEVKRTSMTDPVVFVVDDDAEVRTALHQLLRSAKLSVQTFGSAFEFLENYDSGTPGCLVLDIRMPGMSGLELQSRLASRKINLPVIIITGYGEVPMVVQAMQTGAFDFIQKPYVPMELLRRIQAAVDRDIQQRLHRTPATVLAARLATLTRREQEVLDLLLEEISLETIAEKFDITLKTVQQHRQSLLRKLQAANERDLREAIFPSEADGY